MTKKKQRPQEPPVKTNKPKIAVIGSGICGASTAYYLSQQFKDVDITVFERSAHVGGRMNDIEYKGRHLELGAGFFIEANRNFLELTKKFNCPSSQSIKDSQTRISWDGESVLYSSNVRFHLLRLFYNYGLSIYRLRKYLDQSLSQFLTCYSNIDLADSSKQAFEHPQEFLKQVGFEDLLNKTGLEHVKEIGLKDKFIQDFLYGVVSGIYNNRIETINAVALMVSLQGMFRKAFTLTNGNNSLIRKMLVEKNDYCQVKLESEVRELNYNSKTKKYTVKYWKSSASYEQEDYDLVIIAAPFKQANIKTSGFSLKDTMDYTSHNKKVIVTIVEGRIKNEFFGLPDSMPPIQSILLAEGAEKKLPTIKSLDQVKDNNDKTFVYRIESGSPLSPKLLASVFNEPKVITSQTWEFAYPSLPTLKPSKLSSFRLNDGLYFPSVMEFVSSCMEMQTIAAKNVVKLIAKREGAGWQKAA